MSNVVAGKPSWELALVARVLHRCFGEAIRRHSGTSSITRATPLQTTVIRRATPDDAADLSVLVREYWQFEGLAAAESSLVQAPIERLLASSSLGAAWVASESARPIGYLILVYVFSLEHRGLTAEVDEFYVVAGRRGVGLGSQLLALAEAEAIRNGCANISLQVGSANHHAETFYAHRGYTARSAYHLIEKDLGRRTGWE